MPAEKRTPPQAGRSSSDLEATGETTKPPVSKRPRRGQQPKIQRIKSLPERVNALSTHDFAARYLPQEATTVDVAGLDPVVKLHLWLTSWVDMSPRLREACLDLVEMTSSIHYRASEMGWSRAKKLKEMRHPAMKYLLLHHSDIDAEDGFEGFVSLMVTEEDGYDVIYCYEIHLRPEFRGKAVGRKLMDAIEMIGTRLGLDKAMLTVFKSNAKAVASYQKWGYSLDNFSPQPRRLRDGTLKEPSYIILSKEATRFAEERPREPVGERPVEQEGRHQADLSCTNEARRLQD